MEGSDWIRLLIYVLFIKMVTVVPTCHLASALTTQLCSSVRVWTLMLWHVAWKRAR